MKSILVIDTPNSCSECNFEKGYCDLFDDFKCIALRGKLLKVHNDFMTSRHPQCPLISIDIEELEKEVKFIENIFSPVMADSDTANWVDPEHQNWVDKCNKSINTIKDLINKLGGNGPIIERDTKDFKYVYEQNYDGSEYLLLSNEPIFQIHTIRKNDKWVDEIIEMSNRILEANNESNK